MKDHCLITLRAKCQKLIDTQKENIEQGEADMMYSDEKVPPSVLEAEATKEALEIMMGSILDEMIRIISDSEQT